MCSAAWSSHKGGYELAFNRDEKWARPPSFPPSIETVHSSPGICARDSKAGGTWLFTNSHGITLALLNAYPGGKGEPSGTVSRGEIPLLAARTSSPGALEEILHEQAWHHYSPCHLLLLAVGHVSLFTWDGKIFSADPPPPQPFITSSSVMPEQARAARTARFRQISDRSFSEILSDTSNANPALNIRPCREDGGTVSFTTVSVSKARIAFSLTDKNGDKTSLEMPRCQ